MLLRPGPDREVDAIERPRLAENLDESVRLDRVRHGAGRIVLRAAPRWRAIVTCSRWTGDGRIDTVVSAHLPYMSYL
jgi:hypothetical protein